MAVIAPKPDWAPSVWQDGQYIYLQFPSGMVQRFAFTENGFARALKIVPAIQAQVGYIGGSNLPKALAPKIRIAKRTRERREAANITDEQRKAINDVLRKHRS